MLEKVKRIDICNQNDYSENNENYIVRMIVVGECESVPPKEQVSKRPLKPISQVEELQQDASLERVCVRTPPKG